MAEPEEIADVVLVPGLGRRAYITGAALDVNGGLVVV
jgi:NAD(P)-dependent dehydrogenase (short-subunit alcohol dehydrogenase family)